MRPASKTLGMQDQEKDETHEENGVLFYINKGGFPIDEFTWERMWDHVTKIHPSGDAMVRKLQSKKDLPQVPIPQAPLSFGPSLSIPERLKKIQDYMKELQYNHTGTQFYEIRKNRPVSGLMECAREMIRESLPIKCLEAVILGIFLTNGMLGVERFPLGFKTVFKGHVHRHVVLGIAHGGHYGVLGMSRRDDLMQKPLEFKSLADLVFDFERCYLNYWHSVKKVKVGLPVVHDQHSCEVINWKGLLVNFSKSDKKEITKELDSHSRRMKSLSKSWTSGPYANLKMLNTVGAARDLQPSMESRAGPSRLRRSNTTRNSPNPHSARQTLMSHSPVRQKPSVGVSLDTDYQIRI